MSDFLVLGAAGTFHNPNALAGATGSSESGVICEAQPKMYAPAGVHGETAFRRILFTVIHTAGFGFYATPIIDGVSKSALRTYFSRPAPSGTEERVQLELWMYEQLAGRSSRHAVRGTIGEVLIEQTDPPGKIHFETVYFETDPIEEAKHS